MNKLNSYFDNAATSFPKPLEVGVAISHYLDEMGGAYGRGFYGRTFQVSAAVEETRSILAKMVGEADSARLVFVNNATHAINIVLKGIAWKHKRVWTTAMEHNAVCRPLMRLHQEQGIEWLVLPSLPDGQVDLDRLAEFVQNQPEPDLIIINHGSNVNGVIQPINAIQIQLQALGAPILLDAAQTLGHAETALDFAKANIDFVAITGHKGLCGPTGIGALYIKEPELLKPLMDGGTGSRSESFESPLFMPDKLEAGTPNIVGILGLKAAMLHPPEPRHTHAQFLQLLRQVRLLSERYRVLAADSEDNQGELFSLVAQGCDASTLGYQLYEQFAIETRVGLHCAPMAHQTLKSFPDGTVRFSFSPYHAQEDLDYLLAALKEVQW